MRKVVCADAHEWLFDNQDCGPIITSPPDAAELGWTVEDWRPWFQKSLLICLVAADPAPVVFYVTDRKHDGTWNSKAGMVLDVSKRYGHRPLWHKIALRRPAGSTDLHRPTYSHLIAVGGRSCKPGRATPDVFDRGRVLYGNGMGVNAAAAAVEYVRGQGYESLVNPFCGRGTVLAAANAAGLAAVGIDNDAEQCRYSEGVTL